ncbi:MAG TPA: GMC oxidoreductase, partial [Methylomirabilota bacterium]|nr:GMC oxidoreductase [Methylomirabilota bacterium]
LREGRAVGVEVLRGGAREHVTARREVILCAGAVASPQLLMLSGVGAADDLRPLGIAVVADLPGVGRNLQDHPAVAVGFRVTGRVPRARAARLRDFLTWLVWGAGPLSSNLVEAGGFVRTRPTVPLPNLQLYFIPTGGLCPDADDGSGHAFTIESTLLTPASRGAVRLRSADPLEPPAIAAGYLDAPEDLAVLVEGVKLARRIAGGRAFDGLRGAETRPGSEVRTDEEIAAYVRAGLQTGHHQVGTCRMGYDLLAVVDARFRVLGVDGLRVVDASIMPIITRGDTTAPTIMLAERGADFVRERA